MNYINVSDGYKKQIETGQEKCLDKLWLKFPKFVTIACTSRRHNKTQVR